MKEKIAELKKRVLNLETADFNDAALEIFELQYRFNPVYRQFVSNLSIDISKIHSWKEIPCLPISFYKNHEILLEGLESVRTFESSGTTGQIRSKKYLPDLNLYEDISKNIFEAGFGAVSDYLHIALLPNYIENDASSLIYMVNSFMEIAGQESLFYGDKLDDFTSDLERLKKMGKPIILWGVSFAMLQLCEKEIDLSGITVIETGGMKGRMKEITRQELHSKIKEKCNPLRIHSEYGMTELLSQAYTDGSFRFKAPISMEVQIMELNDPFHPEINGKTGTINIYDLASIETCSFIATEDLGNQYEDGSFEVIGRKDNAEVRGCNLLLS